MFNYWLDCFFYKYIMPSFLQEVFKTLGNVKKNTIHFISLAAFGKFFEKNKKTETLTSNSWINFR